MNLKTITSLFKRKQMTVVQSWGLGGTVSFPGSKEQYIKDGYNASSAVYSIVSIISETFATAPKVLYKVKSKKAAQKYMLATKKYSAGSVELLRLKERAFDEVEDHPLLTLLNKKGFDFMVHLNAIRDVTGDAFIWVNRGLTGGEPLDLAILPSQYMNLKVSSAFEVEGYQLNIGKVRDFGTDEVLHWRHPNLNFDVTGMHLFGQSPLKPISEDYTLAANREGKKAAAKGFKNQGAGGLLSRNEDIPWKPEQRDQLNTYLDEVVNGNDNKLKVRAANAKLSWVQLAMSAADQKIWEGIDATKEDIANVFNFPIHLLSSTSATDNNYDTANKYLVTKTTYSRWISFRDFVNARLLPMFKDGGQYYFDFDISTFPEVQDDQKKLVESLEKMPITLNEFRSMLGWDTLRDENMDKVYLSSNKAPLDRLNQEFGADISGSVQALDNEGVNDYNDDEQGQGGKK